MAARHNHGQRAFHSSILTRFSCIETVDDAADDVERMKVSHEAAHLAVGRTGRPCEAPPSAEAHPFRRARIMRGEMGRARLGCAGTATPVALPSVK